MQLGRRFTIGLEAPRVLALAAVTGVATGLLMALFSTLTETVLFERFVEQPSAVQAIGPMIGLALAFAALRWVAGNASNATTDAYVDAFHRRHPDLPLRTLPGKLLAGVLTIGTGGAVGLEGPATYAGATLGANTPATLRQVLRREEVNVLLTAGAAAGVAAVFKTPATGVVFALELPYRDDIAARALVPALIGAAAGYLSYVGLVGTEPVIGSLGTVSPLDAAALVGAVIIGLLAGLVGRGFAWLLHTASALPARISAPVRIGGAGVVLAGLTLVSLSLFDDTLTLGPGYRAIEWASEPGHGLGLVAALLALRVVATIATVGAGGTGGVFIPLATQGVLLGSLVAGVLGDPDSALFPTIGLAAVLGAAHRTPLAGVMFVAETSSSVFVIPALIAAAVSQLVAADSSVLSGQASERKGHLEARLDLPLASTLRTDGPTIGPDMTVNEFVVLHVIGERERAVPVLEGDRVVGLCSLDEVSTLDRQAWDSTSVGEVMRTDLQFAGLTWTLREAVSAMDQAGVDLLVACDDDGAFVGVVTEAEIVKLYEILDETES